MSPSVEAPRSVLLLVGREEFTPPSGFAGAPCVATHDCLAVAVLDPEDGPVEVGFALEAGPRGDLDVLGRFELESEGFLSVRDVHNRELDAAGVEPGLVEVTVLGRGGGEADEVVFVLPRPAGAPRSGSSTRG